MYATCIKKYAIKQRYWFIGRKTAPAVSDAISKHLTSWQANFRPHLAAFFNQAWLTKGAIKSAAFFFNHTDTSLCLAHVSRQQHSESLGTSEIVQVRMLAGVPMPLLISFIAWLSLQPRVLLVCAIRAFLARRAFFISRNEKLSASGSNRFFSSPKSRGSFGS